MQYSFSPIVQPDWRATASRTVARQSGWTIGLKEYCICVLLKPKQGNVVICHEGCVVAASEITEVEPGEDRRNQQWQDHIRLCPEHEIALEGGAQVEARQQATRSDDQDSDGDRHQRRRCILAFEWSNSDRRRIVYGECVVHLGREAQVIEVQIFKEHHALPKPPL